MLKWQNQCPTTVLQPPTEENTHLKHTYIWLRAKNSHCRAFPSTCVHKMWTFFHSYSAKVSFSYIKSPDIHVAAIKVTLSMLPKTGHALLKSSISCLWCYVLQKKALSGSVARWPLLVAMKAEDVRLFQRSQIRFTVFYGADNAANMQCYMTPNKGMGANLYQLLFC